MEMDSNLPAQEFMCGAEGSTRCSTKRLAFSSQHAALQSEHRFFSRLGILLQPRLLTSAPTPFELTIPSSELRAVAALVWGSRFDETDAVIKMFV